MVARSKRDWNRFATEGLVARLNMSINGLKATIERFSEIYLEKRFS